MTPRYLVTGATGFAGGHIAEACVQRGIRVVTLARQASDTTLLDSLGVEIIRGDLSEVEAIRKATEGVEVVIHAAAKVDEWGPAKEFDEVNVEGTRRLLEAVRGKPLHRFVQVSSLGVYEARDHHGTDESEPLPSWHIDGYTRTKAAAERVVREYIEKHTVPATILRPGFIYGPRDRTVLPRLVDNLKTKRVRYLGTPEKAINTTYVGNLVDAIFLAIEKPIAVGQVYNINDDELVSKRRLMESIADLGGFDRPTKVVPLGIARALAWVLERSFRLFGAKRPPLLTQARIKFLGLNLGFSVEKAKRELGYRPRVQFEEGIEEAMAWWKSHQSAKPIKPVSADTPAPVVERTQATAPVER
jgi:nucleoside-diphosphate-sugar epimerase